MPTYEYECKSCQYVFEAFQRMSEAPLTSCPQCGQAVRRLINGGSGVIFKGSGFYVTDKNGAGGRGSAGPAVKPAGDAAAPASAESPASAGSPCAACAAAAAGTCAAGASASGSGEKKEKAAG